MDLKKPTQDTLILDAVLFDIVKEMRNTEDNVEECIRITENAVRLLREKKRFTGDIIEYYELDNKGRRKFALNVYSNSYEAETKDTALEHFVNRYVDKYGAQDYLQTLKHRLHILHMAKNQIEEYSQSFEPNPSLSIKSASVHFTVFIKLARRSAPGLQYSFGCNVA